MRMLSDKNNDFEPTVCIRGEELRRTRREMAEFFGQYLYRPDDGTGFPEWAEEPSELIEVAWYLAHWQVYLLPGARKAMCFREIAERLCRAFHVPMPADIYSVASRRRARHVSVVDYYAKVRREAHVTYDTLCLMWYRPMQWPWLRGADYKYYFN